MQLLSYSFVLLWALTFAVYYLVPVKKQWYVLLVSGILFYMTALRGFPLNLLLTALTTYYCGIYLKNSLQQQKEQEAVCQNKEEKKALKEQFEKKRKRIQLLYFIFNLGLLVFYKYAMLAVPVLEALAGETPGFLEKVTMPLGISFYTLTAMGYIIDAGRENCQVETNFFKLLLFLFYFPAITQGPFNRFANMKEQFGKEHRMDYGQMVRGIQRFVWGAFKKLVIADRIGIFVDNVYGGDIAQTAGSILACATALYMLQLYADFSGYIDMAMGVSETFDIALPENFKRPFFSKSVAEFWRRWHITLGTWFKDYVMFSFVMSKAGRKLGKNCRKKWSSCGKHVVPIIGTMLVWFLTGAWHGRTVTYLLWGIYYGVIMSISLVLEPQYEKWKAKLRIGTGKGYAFFCMARTWLVVFVADMIIRSGSVAQAWEIFVSFFTRLHPGLLLSKTVTSYGLNKYEFLILAAALLIWLAVSIGEEKGQDIRAFLAAKPLAVRLICYYGIVVFLLVTGIYGGNYDTAVFMYQSF